MKNKTLFTALVTCCGVAGTALADNASTFGPVSPTGVANGGSYAGITLTAADANNGSNGFGTYTSAVTLFDVEDGVNRTFNIHTDQPANFGPAGPEGFGSTLTILAGQASAATTVNLSVRKPNDNEVFGFSTMPPMDNSPGWISLLSDVFELNGLVATGPAVNGKTPVDPYALQITYLDNNLANTNTTPEAYMEDYIYEHGNVKPWTEADIANAGELHLTFFDSSTGQWTHDDLGNFGVGSTVIENYQGSWADFALANSVTDANVGDFVGSWGVDTATNEAWAVLDHATPFAVVPEPGSLALIGLGGMLVMYRSRRRRG